MSYLHVLTDYKRILGGGFLLCFFSGFGQTFLVSVFTPDLLTALDIRQAHFGLIYATATLASAAVLPWLGSMLDRVDTVPYTVATCLAFIVSCLAMAAVQTPWHLVVALFGMRLCGQGLFSHIAITVIARGFLVVRGRALSLVGLGHPVSEALLPLVAALLIGTVGWRGAWMAFGTVLGLVLLPVIPALFRGHVEVEPRRPEAKAQGASLAGRGLPDFIFTWRFWFLVVGVVLPGTILTGLFLYHGILAETRGWTMAWMAAGFAWFAAGQIVCSLVGGVLVDTLGARRMLFLYQLPLALGLGVLALPDVGAWVVPAYLLLAGISSGVGSPLRAALWVEVYGSGQIGTLRSWVASASVMSTALAAPLLGLMLDAGYGFTAFLLGSLVLILLYCSSGMFISKTLWLPGEPGD